MNECLIGGAFKCQAGGMAWPVDVNNLSFTGYCLKLQYNWQTSMVYVQGVLLLSSVLLSLYN